MTAPQKATDPPAPADPSAWAYNARVGLILFFIYLALYAGFIGLATFGKEVMAEPSFGGVNVAILYGLVLIVAAFLLALLYMVLCKAEPIASSKPDLTESQVSDIAQSEEGSA